MKIQQEDITSGAISFSRSSNFAVTTTVTYAQSNLTKSPYSLGTVAGMSESAPISIKDIGSGNTGWVDEQDWTIYNQSFTTSIPVVHTTSGTSSYTLSTNASISVGDLVGIYGAGSWSIGGVLSIAKDRLAGAGSQNAGLVAGGATSPAIFLNSTELFNGSSWSTSGALSEAKGQLAGAGSQNAGLVAGGATVNSSSFLSSTELFNGSSWSTSGFLSVAKGRLAGAGSQNAGLVAGGTTSAVLRTNATELFNGSSWSASGVLSAAKNSPGAAGSQNAALLAGGDTSNLTNATELFNGSSWSASGVLSAAKDGFAGAGSQNAGLISGGATGTITEVTELFNGSSWSTSGALSEAKSLLAGAGSQNSGFVAGGDYGLYTDVTELHNQTLYRKIVNYQDLRSACNIGVAFDVSSLTLSVKFNGYIDNINVTSSNIAVTTAAQWVSKFVTFPRFSPNTSTTNNPSSVVVKNSIDSEDLVVGFAISRTQMQVFTGNLFARDRIGGW